MQDKIDFGITAMIDGIEVVGDIYIYIKHFVYLQII